MTDTIPGDVLQAAREALTRYAGQSEYMWEVIARAVLAERERCAKVCDARRVKHHTDAGLFYEMDDPNAGRWSRRASDKAEEAGQISDAIRKGVQP